MEEYTTMKITPGQLVGFLTIQRGGCNMLSDPGPLGERSLFAFIMLEECAFPAGYPAAYGWMPEHKTYGSGEDEDEE